MITQKQLEAILFRATDPDEIDLRTWSWLDIGLSQTISVYLTKEDSSYFLELLTEKINEVLKED